MVNPYLYLSTRKNRVSDQTTGRKRLYRTKSMREQATTLYFQARAPPTTAIAVTARAAPAFFTTSAYLARWTGTSIPSILSSHQSLSSVNPVELASEALRATCPRRGSKTMGLEAGLVISSYPAVIFTGSVKGVSLGPTGGRRVDRSGRANERKGW